MLDAQSTGSTAVHPMDSAPHPLRDDFAATDSGADLHTDLPSSSRRSTADTPPDARLELAALAQRVETARGKLPLQTDPALFAELSDREMTAERDLAEWIRGQRRRQRKRAVAAELTSEKRDRWVALALRRADDADARWHRRARAARMRVSNSDARLAQLFRRAEWSSRALIGVVILGMVWSGVNVQHNLVPSGDMSDPLYWLSYGFEAMISIPIITIMVVATTAARWGRDIDRGKVIFLEAALLGVTIALNAGPHLVAGAPAKAAEAAVAPVMVGVVIWLHAWVSARYAQLIDDIPLDHTDDRPPTGYHREEPSWSSPLQRMLAPRELPQHDEHPQQLWVSTFERDTAEPSPADPAVGAPPSSTATGPVTPPRTERRMFATARTPESESSTAAASATSSTATGADGPRATSASAGTPPPARPESAAAQQASTAVSPGATQRDVRTAAPTAGEATQPTASARCAAETVAAASEQKPVEPSSPVIAEAAEASARPLDVASPANHPTPIEPTAGDPARADRAAVGPAAVGSTDSRSAVASTRTEAMPAGPTAETQPQPQPDQMASRGAALRIVSDEPRRARPPQTTEDAVQLVLGEPVAELPRRRIVRTGRTENAGTPSGDAGWDIAEHSTRSPISYALGDEGTQHAHTSRSQAHVTDGFAGEHPRVDTQSVPLLADTPPVDTRADAPVADDVVGTRAEPELTGARDGRGSVAAPPHDAADAESGSGSARGIRPAGRSANALDRSPATDFTVRPDESDPEEALRRSRPSGTNTAGAHVSSEVVGAQSPVSRTPEYPDRARRGASVREPAAGATEYFAEELDEDFGEDSDDTKVGTGTIAAAEIDPVRDESGDVAIWSVAREIHRRGPAKIAVDQLVEVLTLTEESRSPDEIARLVGLSVSRIQRILELARSIAMPVAVGG